MGLSDSPEFFLGCLGGDDLGLGADEAPSGGWSGPSGAGGLGNCARANGTRSGDVSGSHLLMGAGVARRLCSGLVIVYLAMEIRAVRACEIDCRHGGRWIRSVRTRSGDLRIAVPIESR